MPSNRREFIKNVSIATATLAFPLVSEANYLLTTETEETLTILHTNDVHSRLDAFPDDGSPNAGLGGVAARATIIEKIRNEERNVLLLDAGDIFQGTPYFNLYKGEPEIKAMSLMGYDAATMGNHDFDGGIDNFAHQLQHAQFKILNCNYDFSATSLHQKVEPYTIIQKGKIKVGILGVGIELKGLVPEELYGKIIYHNAVVKANETAALLKEKGCHLIICLSHLGDKYDDAKVSDEILAMQSFYIDLIIGGHTHRTFTKPRKYYNKIGGEVLVNQVGWAGMNLGRIDYSFSKKNLTKTVKAHTVILTKKTN
jgi:5'-nucleotidase